MRKDKFDAGTLKAIIALVIMVVIYGIQVAVEDSPRAQSRRESNMENARKQTEMVRKASQSGTDEQIQDAINDARKRYPVN